MTRGEVCFAALSGAAFLKRGTTPCNDWGQCRRKASSEKSVDDGKDPLPVRLWSFCKLRKAFGSESRKGIFYSSQIRRSIRKLLEMMG